MNIYLVGGAVRDELLGLPVTERDWVVVGATPRELLDRGFTPVGKDFPVFLHPKTREEYALARTERKTAPGYRGFEVHAAVDVTLEEDLQRRDLTVNAMAKDAEGRLIDPFGGRRDLAARQLRHVSPAFVEDPVRILRVARFKARFAALGFTVAPETTALMAAMVQRGEVDALVAERVWAELHRTLATANPAAFFQVLRSCGALARLFPELDAAFALEDCRWPNRAEALLACLDRAVAQGASKPVRLAALLHDLPPKPGAERAREVCQRWHSPNEYRDLAVAVAEHWRTLSQPLDAEGVLGLLEQTDALRRPERFEALLAVGEAVAKGRWDRSVAEMAAHLRQALAVAAQVSAQPLLAQGYRGKALAGALRAERRRAIAALTTAAFPHSPEA
ncbi:MAG: multifunctional CCA addition/repair protein [Candidatus Competibacterales bacterium]